MAASKIFYLVTSGDESGMRPEALMASPELAAALADKIGSGNGPNVIPMPVLDYVPELITVWTHVLELDRHEGWRVNPYTPHSRDMWDFQAPKLAVDVQSDTVPDLHGQGRRPVMRISHTDRELSRTTAETMLAELRAGLALAENGDGPA